MRVSTRFPARIVGMIVLGLLHGVATGVDAQTTVQGIRPVIDRPIALRGGHVLLELEASRHGTAWPERMNVQFDTGSDTVGDVVWIDADPRPEARSWTSPELPMRVRRIRPSDDSSLGVGKPFLLIDVPLDAAGPLRVRNETLEPIYIDLSQEPGIAEVLPMETRADRPDAASPFEYWRWVLLAQRLDVAPPDPPGNELEQRIARYHADLWRIGMRRLAEASPGAANACLAQLTAICHDRDHQVDLAAWVTDAQALQYLLGVLLDPERREHHVATEALDWAGTAGEVFFWVERDHGAQVVLAMVNPTDEPRRVTFRWEFATPARNREEFPIMVELAPQLITRVMIDRPANESEGEQPQLVIESDMQSRRFRLRPPVHAVRPPGYAVPVFFEPLTLADAQALRVPTPTTDRLATADVRRRNGRWEVFFECYRPDGAAAHLSEVSEHLFDFAEPDAVRGFETVTVFIGPPDAPVGIVTVPEIGVHRIWAGERAAGSIEVRKRSFADRWWCTVVLPDAWLGYPTEPTVLMGFSRTHADDMIGDAAPNPPLPWSAAPGRVELDLNAWLNLPSFGGR